MEFFLKPEILDGIIVGVITLAIGVIIGKILERRSRLVYYLTDIAMFKITELDPSLELYFHSLVIRNNGKKEAQDIEICHGFHAKYYNIYPNKTITWKKSESPDNPIMLIDNLAPKEMVTITYLERYPHSLDLLYQYIKSKEGLARKISVAPLRILPKPINYIIMGFLIWGLFCLVYFLYKLIF